MTPGAQFPPHPAMGTSHPLPQERGGILPSLGGGESSDWKTMAQIDWNSVRLTALTTAAG
jgi:hypothetical protein